MVEKLRPKEANLEPIESARYPINCYLRPCSPRDSNFKDIREPWKCGHQWHEIVQFHHHGLFSYLGVEFARECSLHLRKMPLG